MRLPSVINPGGGSLFDLSLSPSPPPRLLCLELLARVGVRDC